MTITSDQFSVLARLRAQLHARERVNREVLSYYDGSVRIKSLNIAVPPQLSQIGVVSDWPSTVVDTHHERMNFLGWSDNDRFGMVELGRDVAADVRILEAAQDSLVYGVGFLALEQTSAGQWVMRSISPLDGTALWDPVTDQPAAAYRRVPVEEQGRLVEVLYLPGRNLLLESHVGDGQPTVLAEYPTVEGEVAVTRVRNKLRSRYWYGRSLITPAVRYYTEAAARTMLGMEINREFYTTPQRWAMNADMSLFTTADNPTQNELVEAGWRVTMGRMLALPPNEPGEQPPSVGQFSAAPPTPYIEQLRCYSQLLASATGLPSAYLGFSTENPPSGDAIRAWLERLIRNIEGQQRLISPDLRRMGFMLATVAGRDVPGMREFSTLVSETWESPATQQLAAESDAIVKLIGAGVVPATSKFVMDRLRIPLEQQQSMKAQRLKEQMEQRVMARAGIRPDAG